MELRHNLGTVVLLMLLLVLGGGRWAHVRSEGFKADSPVTAARFVPGLPRPEWKAPRAVQSTNCDSDLSEMLNSAPVRISFPTQSPSEARLPLSKLALSGVKPVEAEAAEAPGAGDLRTMMMERWFKASLKGSFAIVQGRKKNPKRGRKCQCPRSDLIQRSFRAHVTRFKFTVLDTGKDESAPPQHRHHAFRRADAVFVDSGKSSEHGGTMMLHEG
uniref:Uncharacterized protein n=1 Tax=Anopheles farauti TaxID=69004 RepID=A0A182Q0Q5_9DIPT